MKVLAKKDFAFRDQLEFRGRYQKSYSFERCIHYVKVLIRTRIQNSRYCRECIVCRMSFSESIDVFSHLDSLQASLFQCLCRKDRIGKF